MSIPLTYAISSGEATDSNFDATRVRLIEQAKMLAEHKVSYFQIREKRLSASNLYALSSDVVRELEGTSTRTLINDRADIAASVGAYGVHLASNSLPVETVRKCFGDKLAVFVSTHSADEMKDALRNGADAVVFGPIFSTPGKSELVGLAKLTEVVGGMGIPVFALGGLDIENCRSALNAGAAGIAGVRAFADAEGVTTIMSVLSKNE